MMKRYAGVLLLAFWCLTSGVPAQAAQNADLELKLDVLAATVPLPRLFRPAIDLGGRGFHRDAEWPQAIASPQALEAWEKEIGFGGTYRLQFNLWELGERAKDKEAYVRLLERYEGIIAKISNAGGVAVLTIFGTPAGMGKVLDKRSAPADQRELKQLVKNHMRYFSCDKKYSVWYEVWSAPDNDDFFLGRKQEYLTLYRMVAEAARELGQETKVHIPVGGPGASCWFQDPEGNTIITPERSLVYDLIRYCYRYRLPLDFVSWHSYGTDPQIEKETTVYRKTTPTLIRDWLSYFHFGRATAIMVSEWNYDRSANILPERAENSFVGASYIPSRLKNMHEAGLDHQIYFSLEDFQSLKENVIRNVGVFWFDPESHAYKGGAKSTESVFRMLASLGEGFFPAVKLADECAGVIATKSDGGVRLLVYNYVDPELAQNYLARNISTLSESLRKALIGLIRSAKLEKVIRRELDVKKLRLHPKLRTLLKKAQELNDQALACARPVGRTVQVGIKNLSGDYVWRRYVVDSNCGRDCQFVPVEEKRITADKAPYQETLTLTPYSVQFIMIDKAPATPTPPPEEAQAAGAVEKQAKNGEPVSSN